ncbi:hypothetical protein OFC47_27505, partial [Escherichia coli]|nr:hypothetical protein [Escherichia coli]
RLELLILLLLRHHPRPNRNLLLYLIYLRPALVIPELARITARATAFIISRSIFIKDRDITTASQGMPLR